VNFVKTKKGHRMVEEIEADKVYKRTTFIQRVGKRGIEEQIKVRLDGQKMENK
jgi:hypothetical protein